MYRLPTGQWIVSGRIVGEALALHETLERSLLIALIVASLLGLACGGILAHYVGRRVGDIARVADRIGAQARVRTIAELLDRYALEVVPRKAATNQAQHVHWIKQLRAVFGAMPLDALEPQHIYQYVEKRSRKKTSDAGKTTGGRIAAHREVEVLSHSFTKAVQWGYVRAHPFKNEVRLEGEAPRERYIEDWEVVEVLSLPSVRKRGSVLAIQSYIRLKLLTGLRRRGKTWRLKIPPWVLSSSVIRSLFVVAWFGTCTLWLST